MKKWIAPMVGIAFGVVVIWCVDKGAAYARGEAGNEWALMNLAKAQAEATRSIAEELRHIRLELGRCK